MLNHLQLQQSGFSLIELLIGIVIVGILFSLGLPSFNQWSTNSKIRNWAESIQSGLQIARSQALTLNATTRFQLVDSLTSSCATSITGTNWIVSSNDITASAQKCDQAIPDPNMIQGAAAEYAGAIATIGDDAVVCFNGLGQIDRTTAGCALTNTAAKFAVSAASATCVDHGGEARCLQVCAGGGTVKMCDPAVGDNTDPRYCQGIPGGRGSVNAC